MRNGVHVRIDGVQKLMRSISALVSQDVLVGIPATKTDRKPVDGEPETENNATIGYQNEFGSPAKNIPARPFLRPGIAMAGGEVAARFRKAAVGALAGKPAEISRQLNSAGQLAADSAKDLISRGIPPGLSTRTLEARVARKKGSGKRIGKGAAAQLELNETRQMFGLDNGMENAKPLIDTGQLLRSITYVLRRR